MEFDLDKALEDVPIHVEDTSTSSQTPPTPSQVLPKLEQRPAGTMVELPSEEEKKLQHFTKLRPRRNKKIHSSKVPVSNALQGKNIWLYAVTFFKKMIAALDKFKFISCLYMKSTTWLDCIPLTHMHGSSRSAVCQLSDSLTSSFSKSTVLHLRMGSRTASWEGWMRV